MGQSFTAADGRRGSRVKGSRLIIQGSSLIMSKPKVKEHFLIWHQLENCFMQYWSRWQSHIIPCPDWNLSWLTAEDLPFLPNIFNKKSVNLTLNPRTSRFIGPARAGKANVCIHSSLNVMKPYAIKLFRMQENQTENYSIQVAEASETKQGPSSWFLITPCLIFM